jgi:hypothetical protein
MHSAILAALVAGGLGLSALEAASADRSPAPRSFEVPLFEKDQMRIEGVLSKKDYAFKLPEHVRLESGSELTLLWQASPLLLPDVSTMSVQLNNREITSVRLGTKKESPDSQDRGKVSIPLAADLLQPGWNRITVSCLLQTTQSPCRDAATFRWHAPRRPFFRRFSGSRNPSLSLRS